MNHAPAASPWIGDACDGLYERMVTWRRHVHANPELGYEEYDTTAFIRSLLEGWGLHYETPMETATVAVVRGDLAGPTLVVRGDIDALPIQEESGAPYASTRPGVMHGCGHDAHTAILLGLAESLSRREGPFRGEVRLLFQPAEERADGGAPKVMATGVLDGAAAVVGLHVATGMPIGTISLQAGPISGSEDRFDITLTGKGGHAASPHDSLDALVVAAGLVTQLQTLVSRRINPLQPAVVTVGSFHAGSAYNSITGEAVLSGTVRAMDNDTRDLLEADLVRLTKSFAEAHGTLAEVTYYRGNPSVVNDARAVEFARPAAEDAVGADGVVPHPIGLGAEDFAYYAQRWPSVFADIGADPEVSYPHHHPKFDINEESLAVGLSFFRNVVERWVNPDHPAPAF